MADRALEPLAGCVTPDVDRDHRWQPGEEQPRGMSLAAEVPAHKPRRFALASQPHSAELACQEAAYRFSTVDQPRCTPLQTRVGIAVRKDHDVAGRNRDVLRVPAADHRPALGDQVVADQPFRSR